MGRLPHPAGEGRLETKEKAPIAECLPQMGSLRIHPPLSCFMTAAGESRGAGGTIGCRYPLASYTRIVPQKSTVRVRTFTNLIDTIL